MELKYKRIAVDFDGTISDLVPHPEIGDIKHYVKETFKLIKIYGGEIGIWTCRGGDDAEKIKDILKENDIPYDYFNEHFDYAIDTFGGPDSPKIWADIYIDEKGLWAPKVIDWVDICGKLFFDNENWYNGDTVEAIEDIPGGIKKGERFPIKIKKENPFDDEVIIGPMATDIGSAKLSFRKVR